MKPAPLLAVRHLRRDYRGGLVGKGHSHRALDDVSLEVSAGQIFAIVGESGCGKSTLARLVTALDRPTAGRVMLAGDDLFALPPRALLRRRRDVQMVFQDPYGSLDPRQSVGRIVAEPLHALDAPVRGVARAARVVAALESVGLDPAHARLYPHQFSGGQRQRIAIARALITGPKLVVADEPVSALDLSVQAQILNLILDLRQEVGTAVLFISHDLAVVRSIADAIGVMYLGRIVETGDATSVLEAPLHPYTQLLLDAEPAIDAAFSAPPRPSAPRREGAADWSGCAFRRRCPRASERCARETPLLRQLSGRAVACHHAEPLP